MHSEHVDIIEKLTYRFQAKQFHRLRYNDDGCQSNTTIEQRKVEDKVLLEYEKAKKSFKVSGKKVLLEAKLHIDFLKTGLFTKEKIRHPLDASRSWVIYWILHSLYLLRADNYTEIEIERIISTFSQFQNATGGFGGGPHQQSHLAPTYAAINSLVLLKRIQSLNLINLAALRQFLLKMKLEDGSYTLHESGEVDVRGVYCALSVASLCGFLPDEELTKNTAQWVLSCQTYEGGFGGRPGCEAHGGYTFCAVASLTLLASLDKCNMKSLLRWSVNRQLPLEGGFSGRTNKLVDGCYSFWTGALSPIIQAHLESSDEHSHMLPEGKWLFNQLALQEYILCCCQFATGGLLDKPGVSPDYYHTCYTLSGLSVAQNSPIALILSESVATPLPPVHPVFNIDVDAVTFAHQHFASR